MARIIVVEDDTGQLDELLSFLEHSNHEVRGAQNGSELESHLSQFVPNIVLLDYNLPGETGARLAGLLRERFGTSVGIVMVTAYGMSSNRIECRRAGADDYLVKPIDFGELLALIDNLLVRLNPPHHHPVPAWQLMARQSTFVPPRGEAILLTTWEVLLLEAIAKSQDQTTSRDTLIYALGKDPLYYDPRALETVISRLRRKIPALKNGHLPLQAVRNIGYKFIQPIIVVR